VIRFLRNRLTNEKEDHILRYGEFFITPEGKGDSQNKMTTT